MTLTLNQIVQSETDYVILDCNLSFLIGKTSKDIKRFSKQLSGFSIQVLRNQAKVKEITPKNDPEYFI